MDKRLLSILRCPVTHKGLSVARRDMLDRVNGAIGDGQLVNRDGVPVEAALAEALVTDDGCRILSSLPREVEELTVPVSSR